MGGVKTAENCRTRSFIPSFSAFLWDDNIQALVNHHACWAAASRLSLQALMACRWPHGQKQLLFIMLARGGEKIGQRGMLAEKYARAE